MSQINADAECSNMEREKREIKLTAKAMENKIERLQHEHKSAVNKIKELIPQIKAHMKSKENVTEIPSQLNNVVQVRPLTCTTKYCNFFLMMNIKNKKSGFLAIWITVMHSRNKWKNG